MGGGRFRGGTCRRGSTPDFGLQGQIGDMSFACCSLCASAWQTSCGLVVRLRMKANDGSTATAHGILRTRKAIAEFLDVTEDNVTDLARRGMPCRLIGNELTSTIDALVKWIGEGSRAV